MFFVKATLAPGVCVHVDIRNDNVYTHCHCCGEEMRVNLNKVRANTKGARAHRHAVQRLHRPACGKDA